MTTNCKDKKHNIMTYEQRTCALQSVIMPDQLEHGVLACCILSWTLSVTIILYGLVNHLLHVEVGTMNNNLYFILKTPAVLMALGALLFANTVVGYAGFVHKNENLLKLYLVFLILLFTAQNTSVIVLMYYGSEKSNGLEGLLGENAIKHYLTNITIKSTVDRIQSFFECCGFSFNAENDWSQNVYYGCKTDSNNTLDNQCSVPQSCCKRKSGLHGNKQCGSGSGILRLTKDERMEVIHSQGCISKIQESIQESLMLAIILVTCAALLDIAASFFSWKLLKRVHVDRQMLTDSSGYPAQNELIKSMSISKRSATVHLALRALVLVLEVHRRHQRVPTTKPIKHGKKNEFEAKKFSDYGNAEVKAVEELELFDEAVGGPLEERDHVFNSFMRKVEQYEEWRDIVETEL